MSRYASIDATKYMFNKYPVFFNAVRKLERQGWHRANALDYLFGKIVGLDTGTLHPSLYKTVECSVAKQLYNNIDYRYKRIALLWAIQKYSESSTYYLSMSKLNKSLFRW